MDSTDFSSLFFPARFWRVLVFVLALSIQGCTKNDLEEETPSVEDVENRNESKTLSVAEDSVEPSVRIQSDDSAVKHNPTEIAAKQTTIVKQPTVQSARNLETTIHQVDQVKNESPAEKDVGDIFSKILNGINAVSGPARQRRQQNVALQLHNMILDQLQGKMSEANMLHKIIFTTINKAKNDDTQRNVLEARNQVIKQAFPGHADFSYEKDMADYISPKTASRTTEESILSWGIVGRFISSIFPRVIARAFGMEEFFDKLDKENADRVQESHELTVSLEKDPTELQFWSDKITGVKPSGNIYLKVQRWIIREGHYTEPDFTRLFLLEPIRKTYKQTYDHYMRGSFRHMKCYESIKGKSEMTKVPADDLNSKLAYLRNEIFPDAAQAQAEYKRLHLNSRFGHLRIVSEPMRVDEKDARKIYNMYVKAGKDMKAVCAQCSENAVVLEVDVLLALATDDTGFVQRQIRDTSKWIGSMFTPKDSSDAAQSSTTSSNENMDREKEALRAEFVKEFINRPNYWNCDMITTHKAYSKRQELIKEIQDSVFEQTVEVATKLTDSQIEGMARKIWKDAITANKEKSSEIALATLQQYGAAGSEHCKDEGSVKAWVIELNKKNAAKALQMHSKIGEIATQQPTAMIQIGQNDGNHPKVEAGKSSDDPKPADDSKPEEGPKPAEDPEGDLRVAQEFVSRIGKDETIIVLKKYEKSALRDKLLKDVKALVEWERTKVDEILKARMEEGKPLLTFLAEQSKVHITQWVPQKSDDELCAADLKEEWLRRYRARVKDPPLKEKMFYQNQFYFVIQPPQKKTKIRYFIDQAFYESLQIYVSLAKEKRMRGYDLSYFKRAGTVEGSEEVTGIEKRKIWMQVRKQVIKVLESDFRINSSPQADKENQKARQVAQTLGDAAKSNDPIGVKAAFEKVGNIVNETGDKKWSEKLGQVGSFLEQVGGKDAVQGIAQQLGVSGDQAKAGLDIIQQVAGGDDGNIAGNVVGNIAEQFGVNDILKDQLGLDIDVKKIANSFTGGDVSKLANGLATTDQNGAQQNNALLDAGKDLVKDFIPDEIRNQMPEGLDNTLLNAGKDIVKGFIPDEIKNQMPEGLDLNNLNAENLQKQLMNKDNLKKGLEFAGVDKNLGGLLKDDGAVDVQAGLDMLKGWWNG